jgi:hypothetical protein
MPRAISSTRLAICFFIKTISSNPAKQFTRDRRSLPQVKLNRAVKNIHALAFEDFELVDYDPHPSIKALIACIKKLFFCLSAARPLA